LNLQPTDYESAALTIELRARFVPLSQGESVKLKSSAFFLLTIVAHAGEFDARYSAKLSGLDQKRPESVCEARDTLRTLLPKASTADRASMFRAFLNFNGTVANNSMDDFSAAIMPANDRAFEILSSEHWKSGSASASLRSDPQVRKAIQPWLDCGFGIYQSEGFLYIGVDIATVEQFAPMLPADLRAWVNFLSRQSGFADSVEEDAGLILSWRELGDRLHRWENFLRAHPSLVEEMRPEIHRMAWFFFCGLDNSPLTEFGSDRIDPEVLSAWRRFATDPSPSRYTPAVRKAVAILDANGHKLVPEIKALTQWVEQERKDDFR
jgi:hypothetical protein